jgi:hypothetical protein
MTTSDKPLYKVLGASGRSIHGGKADWSLPAEGGPGAWMPRAAKVKCCSRGYHLVELYALPMWLRADCTIYEAEGRGTHATDGTGKTAFSQARLIRQRYLSAQDMRLFAADCAEHVLHMFEERYPSDDRPRKAIEAARAYARGEMADAAEAAYAAADAAEAAAAAADVTRQQERKWQGERLATYLRDTP